MNFATPWALALLALIPPAVWWAIRPSRWAAVAFSSSSLFAGLGGGWRVWGLRLMPIVQGIAVALLIVALARPREGIGRVETSSEAVAMQIVLDRSGSMGLEMESDGSTTRRIDAVKHALQEFVLGNEKHGGKLAGRRQDVIGLITFARNAETVCPLVRDPEMLAQLSELVDVVRERSEDGTAIGDGVALAAARLQRAEEELQSRPENKGKDLKIKSKVIVLFTDGDNNAGERTPKEAAELAAQWGIKIYALGIGSGVAYQTVDTPIGRQRIPVPGTVDTRTLTEMAKLTGGVFREANDADALRAFYEELDKLEKTTIETTQYTDYEEKFSVWAASGGALLFAQALLSALVFRRSP